MEMDSYQVVEVCNNANDVLEFGIVARNCFEARQYFISLFFQWTCRIANRVAYSFARVALFHANYYFTSNKIFNYILNIIISDNLTMSSTGANGHTDVGVWDESISSG